MERRCFIKDHFVDEADAAIGIRDIGILRGFGVYDGIAALGTHIFRWEDHIKRFRASGMGLGIHLPYSDQEILRIVLQLVNHHNYPRTNIRLYLTGGATIGGIEFDPTKPTFFALVEPWSPLPHDAYARGSSLITYEFERQFPEFKTINYIAAVKEQVRRAADGAVEILFVSKGRVLEAATSNIFHVKEGRLITPNQGILKGVTRQVIMELAQAAGIPIDAREVSTDELFAADEVFITSSYKDIVPVIRIDDRVIGDGHVGPITNQLMTRFQDHLCEVANTKTWLAETVSS